MLRGDTATSAFQGYWPASSPTHSRTRVRGFDEPLEAASDAPAASNSRTPSGSSCSYGETASGRQKVTNLRLPGQYDERLLGSVGLQGPYYNWNRWYLPSVGRYLELDPESFKGHVVPQSENRRVPEWYAYAGANPWRFVDPDGRYTKDPQCKFLPDNADILAVANFITDECLRKCVIRQINDAHLDCKTQNDFCAANPNVAGFVSTLGNCHDPTHNINWCSLDMTDGCRAAALVHEFAHSCGWDHFGNKGVPGNTGVLYCGKGG